MSDAKTDVEKLMNEMIPVAQAMLADLGQFWPYGAYMKPDGQIETVAVQDDQSKAEPGDVIALMQNALRAGAQNGQYKATAIFYDVRIAMPNAPQDKTDAIAVSLDHQDDYAITAILPYDKTPAGEIVYGNMFAQKAAGGMFS